MKINDIKKQNKLLSNAAKVDVALQALRDKKEGKDAIISTLTERIVNLEKANAVFTRVANMPLREIQIKAKTPSGTSESAAVFVWSDWHIEERVYPEQVGQKNEFTLDIADRRFQQLLQGGLAWYQIESARTQIKTIVIALLGDFITGSIHDDLSENNQLPPAEAIHRAYSMIVAGLTFFLENTPPDVKFIIPCHSGNHGRMTKEQRIATEAGNSLEYYMYLMLRDYFTKEKRLEFIVQPGYHSYVTFFDRFVARFHHGHQINYQGGVGGITIPVNKAIAQWNKARPADLDVFGHFHTKFDGGNFICNGSLIGYNAYAVSIKASFEKPSQTFFLVNKKFLDKTVTTPVFLK